MQKSELIIDFDEVKSRFTIMCPYWANDLVKIVPSIRWNKSARAWVAPLIRRNADAIRELSAHGRVTQAAIAAIERGSEPPVTDGPGFPHWYHFKTEPRAHQRRGLDKLYGLTAGAMFMDRGTGKTKTTIDIACALRMEGKIDAMLVVAKLTLRRTWQDEIDIHAPIPIDVHLADTSKASVFRKWVKKPHDMKCMVIGIESLSAGGMHELMNEFLLSFKSVLMVIDETHMIANHKATRTERCITLGRQAKYRLALTGTPISDGPMNLYAQFEYLDPDIIGIGDFYAFRNRYAVMGGYRDPKSGRPMEIVGYQNMDELIATIAPYTFQVLKSDVLDLPPKVFKTHYITPHPDQKRLYNQIRRDKAFEWKGKDYVPENVLELVLRLHQVIGGWVTTWEKVEMVDGRIKKVTTTHTVIPPGENPKILELLSIVGSMPKKQMIVWCAYLPELMAVAAALERIGCAVGLLHGGVSEDDRWRTISEFQAGKITHIVGNVATGGTGTTMTAAEVMVYFNNTRKLVDREQSEDRAHRDGLKHSVLYIDLVMERTVDELVLKSLQDKKDLSDYVRGRIKELDDLIPAL